jgi:hypothetical protein
MQLLKMQTEAIFAQNLVENNLRVEDLQDLTANIQPSTTYSNWNIGQGTPSIQVYS